MGSLHQRHYKKIFTSLFFVVYICSGIFLFPDYGVSLDEPAQRTIGGVNVKYVEERIDPSLLNQSIASYPDLGNYLNKYYGPAFEVPLTTAEGLLDVKDMRDVYLLRHLLTFLFSTLGVLALYATAARRFADYRIGLLAASFMILSPRIFADSFYNSKDIVFMASFSIAIYTMIRFLLKKNISSAILHGFTTAFATDVRIMGVLMLTGTIAVMTIRLFKKEMPIGKFLSYTAIYVCTTCLFTVLMFPFLWNAPLKNFLTVFSDMAQFPNHTYVLFMGRYVNSMKLPWLYAPIWISITTPPIYLGLFLFGTYAVIKQIRLRRPLLWSNDVEMQDLIFLGFFLAPIASVIFFKSVLYNGWRQLYFIYPAFILVATGGLVFIFRRFSAHRNIKILASFLIFLGLFHNAFWMRRAHPVENVYFNILAGKNWRDKFELDYWGLGNKQALQFILNHDSSPVITVRGDGCTSLDLAGQMLPSAERARLAYSSSRPVYVLTNYYMSLGCMSSSYTASKSLPEYSSLKYSAEATDAQYAAGYSLFYQEKVSGEIILSVYRRKDAPVIENAAN